MEPTMAKAKAPGAESVAEKSGRALVDLPAFGLKSGEYGTLPTGDANALSDLGSFDVKAEKAVA